MTLRFAVAGKGGAGKSTFCALLTRELIKLGYSPVLAVDADPNSNLGDLLDVKYTETISDVRDELRDESKKPAGTSKSDYIAMRLNQIIAEGNGVDLIAMGRPEGRECYCYVNELLRGFLSNLAKNYKTVIIDNEAGMEHLTRRTTDNVDALFIVSDSTAVSLRAAERISETAEKIKLKIGKKCLVLNRSVKPPEQGTLPAGIEYLGAVPFDKKILELAEDGKPLVDTPADSAAAAAVNRLAVRVLEILKQKP